MIFYLNYNFEFYFKKRIKEMDSNINSGQLNMPAQRLSSVMSSPDDSLF